MTSPARSCVSTTIRWLAVAAACCALVTIGIAAPQSDPSLTFRRLTTHDGLPNAEVQCVLQDSRGFLWFGTLAGLARNDGHEMRVFRPEAGDPHSLGDWHVNDLKEDAQGNLWVATGKGLDYWERATERFTHFRNDPASTASLSHNGCSSLIPDADGSIWVGTLGGLNRFDPRSGRWDRFFPKLAIRCLLRDRKGMIWLGTRDGGLNQFDPKTGRLQAYTHDRNDPKSLCDQRIRSLAEDVEGGLWIGTDDGLCRLDPERRFFERFGFAADDPGTLPSQIVDTVLVDRAGDGVGGLGRRRVEPPGSCLPTVPASPVLAL